jgi:hypothetical protein
VKQGRILDSNILIGHLRGLKNKAASGPGAALAHADDLIRSKESNCIVTPVLIEVLAGTSDPHDLALTEAFLSRFEIVDKRSITKADWKEAERIAKRVVRQDRKVPRQLQKRGPQQRPRTGGRDLGDCLILAIANRLHYDVDSNDQGLQRQDGRTS